MHWPDQKLGWPIAVCLVAGLANVAKLAMFAVLARLAGLALFAELAGLGLAGF